MGRTNSATTEMRGGNRKGGHEVRSRGGGELLEERGEGVDYSLRRGGVRCGTVRGHWARVSESERAEGEEGGAYRVSDSVRET